MAEDYFSQEYQTELEAARRKQQLAEMLQQRAMNFQPAQSQGRIASKTPFSALLANLGTQYVAGRSADQAGEQAGLTRQRFENEQNQAVEAWQKLPEAAKIPQGTVSRYPMIRKLAQALQERKQAILDKSADLIGKRDVGMAVDTLQTGQIPQGSTIPRAVTTVNDQRVYENEVGDFRDRSGPPININGDLFQETIGTGTLRSINNAPRVNVTNTARETNKAYEAMGAQAPEIGQTTMDQGRDAVDQFNKATMITRLAQDPQVITGFGAEPRLFLEKASVQLFGNDPNAAAKTETLLSGIAEQTLDASTELKGATTDRDWDRLGQARAGKISYTPESIQELGYIAQAKAYNRYIRALRQREAASQFQGTSDVLKAFPLPPPPVAQLSPNLFEPQPDGTVRYIGSIEAITGKTPPPKKQKNEFEGFKVVR